MILKIGKKAPQIVLPDQNGQIFKLSNFLGKWVLVYFYPKDDTPGCTAESCSFRDNFPKFGKINAAILGVSADSVASHKKFTIKYKLPFVLLADEQKKALKKYGVWQEKTLYGRKYMGIMRTSFLINPSGKIVKIYEKVKPDLHAKEVLSDLKLFAGKPK